MTQEIKSFQQIVYAKNMFHKEMIQPYSLIFCVSDIDCVSVKYRNGAINSRSWNIAAPLTFQAKTQFLCVFYVVIQTPK